VFVQGRLQKNEKFAKIIAESIVPMEKVEELWSASIHMTIDAGKVDERLLDKLNQVLKNYPGQCKGFLHVLIPGKTETIIALPQEMGLRAGVALTNEVNRLLGYPSVTTVCSPIQPSTENGNNRGNKFARRRI
jgi:DNA polymerase-3 subunit alpha